MRIVIVSQRHSGEQAAVSLHKGGNGLVLTISPELMIAKERYVRSLHADFFIISDALSEPDRNDCLQKACDVMLAAGRDKEYIKSHIIFA